MQRAAGICFLNMNSCGISVFCHLLVKALGAAEARWAVGSPGGARRWQSGVGAVRPPERRDLSQESFDGSAVRPPDRQEASVAWVLHNNMLIVRFIV